MRSGGGDREDSGEEEQQEQGDKLTGRKDSKGGIGWEVGGESDNGSRGEQGELCGHGGGTGAEGYCV